MGKLIMWNIITLDGYFEGTKSWDLDFHNAIWGQELEELSIQQLNEAGALIFGRVTYEGMAAHWTTEKGEIADHMNSIPKLVFSTTFKNADWNNTTIFKKAASSVVQKLKEEEGGDLYVFGSAKLSGTFVKDDLFDEYRIGISPVILRKGRPLFGRGNSPKELNLVSTQQLKTGGVVLKYTRKH